MVQTEFQQLRGDDDSRYLMVMEKLCNFGINDVDVPDQRHWLHTVAVHIKTKLANLLGIVPDLIDDELRAAFDFLPELEILRNDFAFMQLEICCYRTNEKFRFAEKVCFVACAVARVVEAVIHFVQH